LSDLFSPHNDQRIEVTLNDCHGRGEAFATRFSPAHAHGARRNDSQRKKQQGGSDSPEGLLKPLGVNIHDLGFWQKGFQEIGEMIKKLEGLVAQV
jgi:oligoendopeptidase F